jgi:hypothetical protein
MMRHLLALLLALIALPQPAAAWWEYGHETIATIAAAEAKPATRREIARLLARSSLLETPTCPTRTIEQASVWADCVKELGDRFSYAYAWHYQNVEVCKPFDPTAACKDGNCVSKQIERARRMLADRKLPTRDRIEALAFLVHFMGDLHQPLHAGDRSDRGGNDVLAAYGAIAGKRTNLHAIWDGLLADRAISTPAGGALGVLEEIPAADRTAIAAGSVEDWARESWQVAHDSTYAVALGDPCGPKPDRAILDEAKIRMLVAPLRLQVARGGIRLARLLDEALANVPPPAAQ